MALSQIVRPIMRIWTSESSPVALRTKQLIASVVPEPVLLQLKKRYYIKLLRNDSDERMEVDARALPLLVKPGDFVLDVGAFVGFYTQRLSRLVGPAGAVWSFEPMPQTHQILQAAVKELALGNVRLFPYAMSDRSGAATMEIPRYSGGGESFWDAKIVEGAAARSFRHFQITTRTLDSLLAGTDRPVTFVKIDAEYHELQVMRGAVESFRRWHPVIQVETLEPFDDPGTDFRAMLDLLGGLGYRPYRFDGTAFHERHPGERDQNLFFMTDAQAASRRR
ncbi:MAG TPA: FkbM family methyltransferase [Vicinamibacterales bacterium]|nr:FkbM family methyltransferase [Vicinamibacterales bacterium]